MNKLGLCVGMLSCGCVFTANTNQRTVGNLAFTQQAPLTNRSLRQPSAVTSKLIHIKKLSEKKHEIFSHCAHKNPNPIRSDRGDLILRPLSKQGEQKALILLPGAEISPEKYVDIARKIQSHTNGSLWVGIAKLEMAIANAFILDQNFPLVALSDYINPTTIDNELQTVLYAMQEAGMPKLKPYISGHSLGGAFLHHAAENNPTAYAGLIHLAAFLPRFLDPEKHPAMKIPNLTICAELDGLVGIMRFAEAFYKQVSTAKNLKKPVVMIEGMNHGQFCSGPVPSFVQTNDIPAEQSQSKSQGLVARVIGDFINSNGIVYEESELASALASTQKYFQPLISSLELEGSYHLKPPCSSLRGERNLETCWHGSPWVEYLTPIVTGAKLDGYQLKTKDEFNPSWVVNFPGLSQPGKPLFHHPKIHRVDFKEPNGPDLIVNTVSEAVYDPLNDFDIGVIPCSARKIRAKFPSRQAINNLLGHDLPFADSELDNIASRANQLAIDWALANAPPKARQRYLERGIKLFAGKDLSVETGPEWIWSNFDKRLIRDDAGECRYLLDATVMKTPLDNDLKTLSMISPIAGKIADELIGGKHFMTLLSPASAMAHICTDSLRAPKAIADKLI